MLGALAKSMGGTAENPNWLTETLTIVGSTFVTLLKTLVPPLIFLAVVASVANLRAVGNAARLAGQTLLWFGITALASVTIGIVLSLVTRPGAHTTVSRDAAAAPDSSGSWLDFLTGIVPTNFLGISAKAGEAGEITMGFNALQIGPAFENEDFVAAFASIAQIEARHSAVVRLLRDRPPAPLPLDKASNQTVVRQALGPYTVE